MSRIANKKENVNAEILELVQNTGEILQDISRGGREQPWKIYKQENLRLAEIFTKIKASGTEYQEIISKARLENLKECGDTLVFLQDAVGNKKLHNANFCRVRLCPMCQWRRSLKLFSQVNAITEKILATDRSTRFVFGTFTIKNCFGENLQATVNLLNKAFKKIVAERKDFAPAKKLNQTLLGYIKAVEVTYNQTSKTYHPHLHIIFAVKNTYFSNSKYYMAKKEWITLWQKALAVDYKPQTNIRVVTSNTAAGVAEVAKYPAKIAPILELPDNEAMDVVATLTLALHKKRFVALGGIFKTIQQELKLTDIETDKDLIHVADDQENFNAVCRVMFKYNFRFGCYIC